MADPTKLLSQHFLSKVVDWLRQKQTESWKKNPLNSKQTSASLFFFFVSNSFSNYGDDFAAEHGEDGELRQSYRNLWHTDFPC